MDNKNISFITEFILVGLTEYTETYFPFFFLFLGIYIITVAGNLGLLTLIGMNSPLHTPMYYFLFNLSFIDLCYSTVITPKLLVNFISERNTISYKRCMTQLSFHCFFVSAECYVLTEMAYDRYVAICKPHYILVPCPLRSALCWFSLYMSEHLLVHGPTQDAC